MKRWYIFWNLVILGLSWITPVYALESTANTDSIVPQDVRESAKSVAEPHKQPDTAEQKTPAEPIDPFERLQHKTQAYAQAYEGWISAPEPQSFETILLKGQQAAADILATGTELDHDRFEALRQQMPGYIMIRHGVLAVTPDADFLLEKMRKHGLSADIDFFEAMSQTLNGYWPVTMERLPDYSGCIRYGSNELVRIYGLWTDFRKKHPGAYQAALEDSNLLLLWDIEDQLLNGRSACDGPETVLQELRLFITKYPDAKLVPQLQELIKKLEDKKSDFAFYQGGKYNP